MLIKIKSILRGKSADGKEDRTATWKDEVKQEVICIYSH